MECFVELVCPFARHHNVILFTFCFKEQRRNVHNEGLKAYKRTHTRYTFIACTHSQFGAPPLLPLSPSVALPLPPLSLLSCRHHRNFSPISLLVPFSETASSIVALSSTELYSVPFIVFFRFFSFWLNFLPV